MPNEAFIRPVYRFDPPLDAVGVIETIEDSHERTFDAFLDTLYAAMLEPDRG